MGEKLIDIFEPQLKKIRSQDIREVVKSVLREGSDNFLGWASSSTGKYHPPDEIRPEGMVIHIKRCVALAPDIARLFNFNAIEEDILIGACILHDLYKRGRNNDDPHTDSEHPVIVYEKIKQYGRGLIWVDYIANACLFHEGQWTIPVAYDIGRRPTVYAEAMHIIDMVVSRRVMHTIMQPEWTAKVLRSINE